MKRFLFAGIAALFMMAANVSIADTRTSITIGTSRLLPTPHPHAKVYGPQHFHPEVIVVLPRPGHPAHKRLHPDWSTEPWNIHRYQPPRWNQHGLTSQHRHGHFKGPHHRGHFRGHHHAHRR